MSKNSLVEFDNRLVGTGETLAIHWFESGNLSLAVAEEHDAWERWKNKKGLRGLVTRLFTTPPSVYEASVPVGTRLCVRNAPRDAEQTYGISNGASVCFAKCWRSSGIRLCGGLWFIQLKDIPSQIRFEVECFPKNDEES